MNITMRTKRILILCLAVMATTVLGLHTFLWAPAPSYLEILLIMSSIGVCVVLFLEVFEFNSVRSARFGFYLFLGACVCLTSLFGASFLTATTEQLYHVAVLLEREEVFRAFFYERYGRQEMLSMLDGLRLQAFAAYNVNDFPQAVDEFVKARSAFRP